MKDYSICLIQLNQQIKEYRQLVLKNQWHDAEKLCVDIVSTAIDLENYTQNINK